MDELLSDAATRAARYLSDLKARRVAPSKEAIDGLDRLGDELPDEGLDPAHVLRLLDEAGSPATVASAGGRYFGFIVGSALPAALATDWLASAWNQNGAMTVMSPVAARLEQLSVEWSRRLLGLPEGSRGALVTGDTVANLTCLAAARRAVLERSGWDLKRDGLHGAPRITVIVGEEVHVSVLKALALLGIGSSQLTRVPADEQGRMRADRLPAVAGPTIVCAQAGNVNSGAIDPVSRISESMRRAGAWVHVDGAFGLWARASRTRRELLAGVEDADSWATDCHKWLNVPYDCGIAFVRDPGMLREALSTPSAAYLPAGSLGEPMDMVPEMSRRARGAACWGALSSLGRLGVESLVDRTCELARLFAERLASAGFSILNEVVLNQVLVSFGSDQETRRVVAGLQAEGTCWVGPTVWHGKAAMRISVSSWATTREDVESSIEAMIKIAHRTE